MNDASVLLGLRQPDQLSCGPTALVAARMLLHTDYRPADPAAEILALHRSVTSAATSRVPWPRALGTPPWAVARRMRVLTARRHQQVVARFRDPAPLVDRARAATGAGLPVPLFVGDRWLPRHVVLAVGAAADGLTIYDPARGTLTDVPTSAFTQHALRFGPWDRLWFLVPPHR